ncbi:hypothetical protein AAHN97_19155 [Chitinophaga niabensis]|uniref:hypothetical protein n=1 Tax=Chitinophaga niabensis TaxID=536979 RepID=UPI0031BB2F0C
MMTSFKVTVDREEFEVRSELRNNIAVFIAHVRGEDITFALDRQYDLRPYQYTGKVSPQLLTKIADAILNLEELDD